LTGEQGKFALPFNVPFGRGGCAQPDFFPIATILLQVGVCLREKWIGARKNRAVCVGIGT